MPLTTDTPTLTSDQIELLNKVHAGELLPNKALKSYPENNDFIAAIYKFAPNSIKHLDISKVTELVDNGLIALDDAIKAFPEDKQLIKKAVGFTIFESEQQVIEAINSGKLDPFTAVHFCPNNIDILKAAYSKEPTAIIKASTELTNALGQAGDIKIEDVVSSFSISIPSEEQRQQTKQRFQQALTDKNWQTVADICQKFWFEKPEEAEADTATVISDLTIRKDFDSLYEFNKAIKTSDHRLNYGPLQKSSQTFELEALFRKFLAISEFKVETIDEVDYFEFSDGERFNWTNIRDNANLQDIQLNEQDIELYSRLFGDVEDQKSSSLVKEKEDSYRDELYKEYDKQEKPRPTPLISFAEMRAINCYTREFDTEMNGLMRGDFKKFNPRKAALSTTRAALLRSVICASGLRKLPETTIKESYRLASHGSIEAQQQRMKAAATKGIEKLDGFISSSINPGIKDNADFKKKPILYKFKNLKGLYIAPISAYKEEQEFLIAQTQVQITDYKKSRDRKLYIEASLVSDLSPSIDNSFKPFSVKTALRYANPKTLAQLIDEGELAPKDVLIPFFQNKEIINAAIDKNPTPDLLSIADCKAVISLVRSGELSPSLAVEAFPKNQTIVKAALNKNSSASILRLANPGTVISLVRNADIEASLAIKAFPQYKKELLAAGDHQRIELKNKIHQLFGKDFNFVSLLGGLVMKVETPDSTTIEELETHADVLKSVGIEVTIKPNSSPSFIKTLPQLYFSRKESHQSLNAKLQSLIDRIDVSHSPEPRI